MGRKKLVTHKKLMKAIVESRGITAIVAKRLQVQWHTADTAIKNDPIALQAFIDESENVLDVAETVIMNALINEDVRTAQWLLERRGSKRGYNPSVELKGTPNEPITLNFIDKEGDKFEKETE